MRRRALNIVTWTSLVLCVATIGVWCRGYWANDVIFYRNGGPLLGLDSRHGEVSLVVQYQHRWSMQGFTYRRYEPHDYPVREQLRWQPDRWRWQFAGFALWTSEDAGQWVATVPCWSIAALAIAWPGALLARRCQRRLRGAAGVCPTCGYDLRATPQRCPECGDVPAAPTAA